MKMSSFLNFFFSFPKAYFYLCLWCSPLCFKVVWGTFDLLILKSLLTALCYD